MGSTTQDLLKHGNPLGRNTSWIVVALEAIALIILGIYVLVDREGAGTAILQITSLVLLIASLAAIIADFRAGPTDLVVFTAFRTGLGAAVGVIGTARWFWSYIDDGALRRILGWGLIAYAVITVLGLLVVRKLGSESWGGLGIAAFTVVLGIVMLMTDDANSSGTLKLLGIVFILGGIVLGGIAYLRYKASQSARSGT